MSLEPYRVPLVHPLRTGRGTVAAREGVLVRVSHDGCEGVGEAAPLAGFSTEHLEDVLRVLRSWTPRPPRSAAEAEQEAPEGPASARHGAEHALLAWLAARRGCALAQVVAARPSARVRVHSLVRDAEDAATAVARGFRCVKVKVGGDLDRDLCRVEAIRRAVGPDVALRVDVNQGWTEAVAREALARLVHSNLELVEEPVADLAAMRRLRGVVPLAADEQVRGAEDLARVVAAGAADAVVVKPMLVGGIGASLRLMRAAQAAGLAVFVTTTFELAPGREAALAVAAACEGVLACGLDTGRWLTRDVGTSFPIEDGHAVVPLGRPA